MKTQVEEKFSNFFERWVSELEEFVKHLMKVDASDQDPHLRALVSKLTAHFKLYYSVKWAQAHQDVLAFFSPSWLTPLETAYNWVTGWKPSMAFRLILPIHPPVSPDQLLHLHQLRLRIKAQQDRVDRDMERHQMALADRDMVHLSRLRTRSRRSGEREPLLLDGQVDVAINALLRRLEKTMKAADCVRLNTLKGILDLLTPLQCVRFCLSISLIHIRLRQWGNNPNPIPPLKSHHQIQ
ncbi:unnamed protein product [Citrullus colocynthis]|uniref:DOG1 domain-containing protein n=1 Tax=Citrullus colocynthis TaxID=252529 RepID=A0ABP0Z403_9ROSI